MPRLTPTGTRSRTPPSVRARRLAPRPRDQVGERELQAGAGHRVPPERGEPRGEVGEARERDVQDRRREVVAQDVAGRFHRLVAEEGLLAPRRPLPSRRGRRRGARPARSGATTRARSSSRTAPEAPGAAGESRRPRSRSGPAPREDPAPAARCFAQSPDSRLSPLRRRHRAPAGLLNICCSKLAKGRGSRQDGPRGGPARSGDLGMHHIVAERRTHRRNEPLRSGGTGCGDRAKLPPGRRERYSPRPSGRAPDAPRLARAHRTPVIAVVRGAGTLSDVRRRRGCGR